MCLPRGMSAHGACGSETPLGYIIRVNRMVLCNHVHRSDRACHGGRKIVIVSKSYEFAGVNKMYMYKAILQVYPRPKIHTGMHRSTAHYYCTILPDCVAGTK